MYGRGLSGCSGEGDGFFQKSYNKMRISAITPRLEVDRACYMWRRKRSLYGFWKKPGLLQHESLTPSGWFPVWCFSPPFVALLLDTVPYQGESCWMCQPRLRYGCSSIDTRCLSIDGANRVTNEKTSAGCCVRVPCFGFRPVTCPVGVSRTSRRRNKFGEDDVCPFMCLCVFQSKRGYLNHMTYIMCCGAFVFVRVHGLHSSSGR